MRRGRDEIEDEDEDGGETRSRLRRDEDKGDVTRSVQKDSWGLLLLDGRYSRRDQRPSSTVD